MTTSQVGGAGAYARAAMLGPAIPVRSIDPTRQRFQVRSEAEPAKNQAAAQAPADPSLADPDEQSAFSGVGDEASQNPRSGSGLLGAFTSFLARMFAQPESETAAPSSTNMQAGVQAYARSAGPLPANENGVEVMPPSFPRLSSGRAVDLTV